MIRLAEHDGGVVNAPGAVRHGDAGVQRCGDWCRHFQPLDPERWEGFGRCAHPLSLRSGHVFSEGHDCAFGAADT